MHRVLIRVSVALLCFVIMAHGQGARRAERVVERIVQMELEDRMDRQYQFTMDNNPSSSFAQQRLISVQRKNKARQKPYRKMLQFIKRMRKEDMEREKVAARSLQQAKRVEQMQAGLVAPMQTEEEDDTICRGVVCYDSDLNYVYDSCELLNYGSWDVKTCAPGSKLIMDCVGTVCVHLQDGSESNSCDMRKFGYDGYTCPPGTRPDAGRTLAALNPILGRQVPAAVVEAPGDEMTLEELLAAVLAESHAASDGRYPSDCKGVMCANKNKTLAYSSCELARFGLDPKECLTGFYPRGGCGPLHGNLTCATGECCSQYGFCGTGPDYCGAKSKPNCGPGIGSCYPGQCCSQYGFCGTSPAHCNEYSLTDYAPPSDEDDRECGPGIGFCPAGECCSEWGYCGSTPDYCNANSFQGL
jgi:hypothetical protein